MPRISPVASKPVISSSSKSIPRSNATPCTAPVVSTPVLNPESSNPTLLESTSSVLPRLEEGRLVGSLNGTTINVREEFSTIGDMSPSFLSMFEKVFSLTTRVLVESLLHKILPIPIIDNVTLANTTHINVFDDFVRLNIDFEFE